MTNPRPRDPLHGVTLEAMLKHLVELFGWERLGNTVRSPPMASSASIVTCSDFP